MALKQSMILVPLNNPDPSDQKYPLPWLWECSLLMSHSQVPSQNLSSSLVTLPINMSLPRGMTNDMTWHDKSIQCSKAWSLHPGDMLRVLLRWHHYSTLLPCLDLQPSILWADLKNSPSIPFAFKLSISASVSRSISPANELLPELCSFILA